MSMSNKYFFSCVCLVIDIIPQKGGYYSFIANSPKLKILNKKWVKLIKSKRRRINGYYWGNIV